MDDYTVVGMQQKKKAESWIQLIWEADVQKWNAGAAFAMLITIVAIGISAGIETGDDTWETHYLKFTYSIPGSPAPSFHGFSVESNGRLNAYACQMVMLIVTFLAHTYYYLQDVPDTSLIQQKVKFLLFNYTECVKQKVHAYRWVEYTISSIPMNLIITYSSGISTLPGILFYLAGFSSLLANGYLVEIVDAREFSATNKSEYSVIKPMGLLTWGFSCFVVMYCGFFVQYHAVSTPAWALSIGILMFLFYLVLYGSKCVSLIRKWDGDVEEKCFILISITSKIILCAILTGCV